MNELLLKYQVQVVEDTTAVVQDQAQVEFMVLAAVVQVIMDIHKSHQVQQLFILHLIHSYKHLMKKDKVLVLHNQVMYQE